MVVSLVDSSIVIDILRSYPASLTWLQSQNQKVGLTRYVWLEVLEGCRNKQEQKAAIRVLDKFDLVSITNNDIEWAVAAFLQHYLKSNTDPFDCLIAATNHRLQVPLYTRNLKHFKPLLGVLAQKPY
ncbi:MAG: PIN domain-containing protein [Anaerolineae bacterium]|nr:PIN domain-containing protein [Anaerolineae bacterium]MDQ7037173.1 PIN domain-containing protein [Anaerolineae bacterium]